ncbi:MULTISPECIES: hypothetical protein [Pontibacillus]|uniref:Uncharacterized protein n=1 Tax=Pontibacillus chungwhensis TaxID=265426 RepID=A0ABY8V0R8_9BACI|nr:MULTISPECIES: hypothetical protein [Pontibacillus]WIF97466.1 hypothetical protein QNI29_17280 [Pontibacillus chungwhensis]
MDKNRAEGSGSSGRARLKLARIGSCGGATAQACGERLKKIA